MSPFFKGLSGKEIYSDMLDTRKDKCPSYAKNWTAEVKRSRTEEKDEHPTEKPVSVSIPANIDAVHGLILEDRRIGLKRIAETLKISYERIFHIMHHELGMRKIFAK
ncbi:hypothetical protein DD587_32110 [Klebsiella pneumoniae]|uniref:hypothetical protein n=1 Tax=Klebsiella pneumoniae TaxID=573 RepID=UPI0010128D08|nr:hypothetical protein [Klebsiella pneumoniae]RXX88639.1 hypothetical protein DD587_32110 [Klebsiella pneumoniae]